ncbi:sulfurtransferase [Streptomyces sp. NPDC004752]
MSQGTPGTRREDVLIDVDELTSLLAAGHGTAQDADPAHLDPYGADSADAACPVLVLDATVALAQPAHDGDYRAASGAAAWARAHIPGSRHVDLLTRFTDPTAPYHFAHPPRRAVRRELASLGATEETTVVLYDQGSVQWAARLWWMLRDAGVPARVLDGGLPAWTAAGLPVATAAEPAPVATAPAPAPAPVEAVRPPEADPFPRAAAGDAARPSLWADKEDVRAVSERRTAGTLVCALSAAHFEGTTPTRYSRRGRIPGSVNLPAQAALSPGGLLLTGTQLRAYARQLPDGPKDPVVLYCGGGISATLGALALTVAGVGELAVYDGSLEEWTADPGCPVHTGTA